MTDFTIGYRINIINFVNWYEKTNYRYIKPSEIWVGKIVFVKFNFKTDYSFIPCEIIDIKHEKKIIEARPVCNRDCFWISFNDIFDCVGGEKENI